MIAFLDAGDATGYGGKFAGLRVLYQLGLRVPPCFALSVDAYHRHAVALAPDLARLEALSLDWLAKQQDGKEAALLACAAAVRKRLEALTIDDECRMAIADACGRLGGPDVRFAVRSSADVEDGASGSAAGRHDSFLGVLAAEVAGAVKACWMSLFTDRAVLYRNHLRVRQPDLPGHDKAGMGVVVQQLIDAGAAGVSFSIDRATGYPALSISAAFGLGEAVVQGEVTPDSWLLRRDGTLLARRRGSTRPPCDDLPSRFALTTPQVRDIAAGTLRVADWFRDQRGVVAVDVEFAVDAEGRVHFVQARPLADDDTAREWGVDPIAARSATLLLAGGLTGSPGVAVGVLRVGRTPAEAEAKTRAGDILACPSTTNTWERALSVAGAVIADVGDEACHAAVFLAELHRPALVGTGRGVEALAAHEGQIVTVDANARRVYLGDIPVVRCAVVADVVAYRPETREESWASAVGTGQTQEAEGVRWLGKPNYPVGAMQRSIHAAAHQHIAARFGCPVRARISGGVHQVDYDTWWAIREALRAMTLEQLEALRDEWQHDSERFVAAGAHDFAAWMASYVAINGWMAVAYDLYKVSFERLHEEFTRLDVPAVYRPRILADAISAQPSLVRDRLAALARLAAASRDGDARLDEWMREYARSYKVGERSDLREPFATRLAAVRAQVERRLTEPQPNPAAKSWPVEHYPEDPPFGRVLDLVAACCVARENAHHQKARGEQHALPALHGLAAQFASRGWIADAEAFFDHSAEELTALAARLAAEGGTA